MRAEVIQAIFDVSLAASRHELLGTGGAHTGCGHDVLGKGLGALQLRGSLGGAEYGDAVRAQHVRHAGDQGDLRANDDEFGVNLLRQFEHLRRILHAGVFRVNLREGGEGWRARRNVQFSGRRVSF